MGIASAWLRRVRQWQWLDEVQNVFLLKLQAFGKQLDPKFFDAKETDELVESDLRELQQWLDNEVVPWFQGSRL